MFVRWHRRPLKRVSCWLGETEDTHWAAILVESHRVDGKPRQRHIAYLGGIGETSLVDERKCHRGWFWERVSKKLDGLDNRLGPDERANIEARIAEKVPRLSRAEFDKCDQDYKRLLGAFFPNS